MKNIAILLLLIFSITISHAGIELPVIYSDGIVLQRDTKFIVNGWASPNEKVTLLFKGKKYNTKADQTGNWSLELPPQKAGGPFDMVFKGENEVKVSDILFGDVWIFSGQSNMTVMMERVKEKYPDEIINANYPDIRYWFVPTKNELNGPANDLPPGKWKEVIQENILDI